MSLKDRFDRFIDYFTEDEDLSLPNEKRDEPILTPALLKNIQSILSLKSSPY